MLKTITDVAPELAVLDLTLRLAPSRPRCGMSFKLLMP